MQGIIRRGHLVLAGLIGGLIGALVVASWASPAATLAGRSQGEQAVIVVNAAVATDSASQSRNRHDMLVAKQNIEAESYPVRIVEASVPQSTTGETNVNTAVRIAGPLDLYEALQAKQQVEAEYYPGRNLSLSAGQIEKGDSEARALYDVLVAKQKLEADYYPGR
jgi:hypothetical protein